MSEDRVVVRTQGFQVAARLMVALLANRSNVTACADGVCTPQLYMGVGPRE